MFNWIYSLFSFRQNHLGRITLLIVVVMSAALPSHSRDKIVVGSKKFTESYILSEIISQLLENEGFEVDRKFGMDGTISFQALKSGKIDIYPDYTGTIARVYLKATNNLSLREIREGLKEWNLSVMDSFGFNNTYAIAVPSPVAEKLSLKTIGDLSKAGLSGAMSYEFLEREDGWPGLSQAYQLQSLKVIGMEHSLAYEAVKNEKAGFTDAYSTDAKLERFGLVVLKDDVSFFPSYNAVPFYHLDLPAEAIAALKPLKDALGEREMIRLNAEAEYGGKNFAQIASEFISSKGWSTRTSSTSAWDFSRLFQQTRRHLFMTFLAIGLAIFFAVPLGMLLFYRRKWAPAILMAAGLLQTVPSIALLAFMIPFFGIGVTPAIAALFLFSILPILRNTYAALDNIDPKLIDSAKGIGLSARETLFSIQLPLAVPIIIAGVRTAAVISVGTATLAAFIGAGGLGESIVTGLALNNNAIILQGAIPAAGLAILIELLFEAIERRLSTNG